MPSPPFCLLRTLSFCAALGLAGSPLFSQAPAATPKQRPPRAEQEAQQLIWLEFPGGSLADYAEAVKKASGDELNVVVDGQASNVEMPAVVLKNVTVETAFRLVRTSVDSEVAKADVQSIGEGEGGKSVYVLKVMPMAPRPSRKPANAAPAEPTKHLQVFPLKRLLMRSDDDANRKALVNVLGAIEVALELDDPDSKEKPVVKYHSESGLMMVRASEEQLSVVSQVITNLSLEGSDDKESPSDKEQAQAKQIEDLRAQIQVLKAEIAGLRNKEQPRENKLESK